MPSFSEINDITGFANGQEFRSEQEVREYFQVENVRTMFGNEDISQFDLDDMAEDVIRNHWHCRFGPGWGCGETLAADDEHLPEA